MADFACDTPSQCDKIERAEKVLTHPPGSNHSLIERGSRMADYSPYSNRDCGGKPEQSANWRSIGKLAAELVRKAGAQ